jgi:hypothetical protein
MANYQHGKIYKITSSETEDVYVGSTCATLKDRLCKHKSAFKSNKKRIGTAKNILKYSDACIELIENFQCSTKKELLDREGEIIKNTPNCVNTQIQGRTMAEYRIDNADKLKQQSVDYRTKNKVLLRANYKEWYHGAGGRAYLEQRKAKINVKVPCPTCSVEYSKSNLKRHMKTHTN